MGKSLKYLLLAFIVSSPAFATSFWTAPDSAILGSTRFPTCDGDGCTPHSNDFDDVTTYVSSKVAAGPNNAIQFNSSSSLAGISTFVFNSASTFMGLGASSPSYPLDIRTTSGGVTLHLSADGSDTGMYFTTNSVGADAAYMGGGATLNAAGNAWIAKAATPVLFGAYGGNVRIFANSGLTPGNSYSPTERFTIIGADATTGINASTPGAQLHVNSATSAIKTAIFRGAASQSANLLELQNSSGTALASFEAGGGLNIGGVYGSSGLDLLYAGSVGYLVNRNGDLRLYGSNAYLMNVSSPEIVINPSSFNTDFRVSGDSNTNLIFADASADRVGISTNAPSAMFHVNAASAGAIGQVIRGATSQSANLFQFQSADGSVLTSVASTGAISAPTFNGVALVTGGTSTEYLSEDGTYSTPAGGSASAGGPNESIQFNNSSAFAGVSTFVYKSASGSVGININAPSGGLQVNTASSGAKGIVVQAAASQTENLFEFQSAGGPLLANVSSAGNILVRDDNFYGLNGTQAGRIVFDDQSTDRISLMNANVGIGIAGAASNKLLVSDIRTISGAGTNDAVSITSAPTFTHTTSLATSVALALSGSGTWTSTGTSPTAQNFAISSVMGDTITMNSTNQPQYTTRAINAQATGTYVINSANGRITQTGIASSVAGTSVTIDGGTTDARFTQNGVTSGVSGDLGTVGTTTKNGISVSVSGTADISYGLRFSTLQDATTLYGINMAATGTGIKHLLANDNQKTYFGTGEDVAIYHTGTDMVFDPESATGKFVFNSSGADTDFNVEGDTDASLIYTDAANDRVGIGTSSPSTKLHVNGTISLDGELRTDGTPASDHSATGPTTGTFNAGSSITAMELVYLASDGEWAKADADADTTSNGMLTIALAAGTDGNPLLVATAGSFVRDDTWNWTPGAILYVDTTTGAITATAPSGSGDIVRVVGYAVTADVIYFLPSGTWIEVT